MLLLPTLPAELTALLVSFQLQIPPLARFATMEQS